MGWRGYDENVWGWTACDGPGGGKLTYKGETREFRTYSARGVSGTHPSNNAPSPPTPARAPSASGPERPTRQPGPRAPAVDRRTSAKRGFPPRSTQTRRGAG